MIISIVLNICLSKCTLKLNGKCKLRKKYSIDEEELKFIIYKELLQINKRYI